MIGRLAEPVSRGDSGHVRSDARLSIGVEYAGDRLRVVALDLRRDAVRAGFSVPLTDGHASLNDAVTRASEALERHGVSRAAPWHVAMSMERCATSVLDLPPRSSGAPVEELAAGELSRGSPDGAVEVAVFDPPTVTGSGDVGRKGPVDYLVIGAAREAIMGILGVTEDIGVQLAAIDVPAAAVSRACAGGSKLVLEVRPDLLSVHATFQGLPVLSRSVRPGASCVSGELVLEEIDRAAAFLSRQRVDTGINEIVVIGKPSAELAEEIGAEFSIHTGIWSPAACWSNREIIGPDLAVAFGAALWPAADGGGS
ncbi:MAG: hypothetical protein AAFR96_08770 [Planctomycetota bacterium]